MKFITFTVPCYNSAAYMRRCIDSLLVAGNDAEIIIVNDGSTDATAEIADEYAEKYPTIVKAIHQENGGHGSGVNQGIKNATGLYFKVVDSDDWLDAASLSRLIAMIKKLHALRKDVDTFICNYVYEHLDEGTSYTMSYSNVFPKNKVFGWKSVKRFHISQYMMMHSLVVSTKLLKDFNVVLPEHTFYVDNIFILSSLPHVRKMCYIDTDLYRYFIGRQDQSVNKDVFMRRLDQHFRVTDIAIKNFDMEAAEKISPNLSRYLLRHIAILCATGSVFLTMKGGEEAEEQRRAFWNKLKQEHPRLYKQVKFTTIAGFTNPKTKLGGKIVSFGYDFSHRLIKYN